jgi:hypothetical protein
MEPIESSETSAYNNTLTPGTCPKGKKLQRLTSFLHCDIISSKSLSLFIFELITLNTTIIYESLILIYLFSNTFIDLKPAQIICLFLVSILLENKRVIRHCGFT